MVRMKWLAAVGCGVLALGVSAWSCGPQSAAPQASLAVSASPRQIAPDGSTTTISIAATDEQGKPGTGTVTLSSPEGTFDATSLTLQNGIATATWSCDAAQSSFCTGTVAITAEWNGVSARTNVSLGTADAGGGTGGGDPYLTPCLGGGANVAYFKGDSNDFIHPGTETITSGTWTGDFTNWDRAPPQSIVGIRVVSNDGQFIDWDFDFTSEWMGKALEVGTYDNAARFPFEPDGGPGLSVFGDGRGCNTLSGSFKVHEISSEQLPDGGIVLSSFTATFVQHCEMGTSALHGCVHFKR